MPGDPLPCVVLLTRSCDSELDAVQDLLRKSGVPVTRLNADGLADVEMLVDLAARALRLNGQWLSPTVLWPRHFSPRAITGPGGPAYDLFLQDSWQAAASQLGLVCEVSIAARPLGQLAQLRIAEAHQVAVPRTVIATDPAQGAAALASSRVVIKALDLHFIEAAPGRLSGIFPAVADRPALAGDQQPGPPVVVQEYVRHDRELRVYYTDGQVHGFEVSKDTAADLWLAPGRVRAQHTELPPPVVSATRRLAAAMSLRYGAFDFLVRDGVPVFLEMNAHGDWRWIETLAGTNPVTHSAARMLCDLHRQSRRVTAPATGKAFDLVSFLS